MAIRESLDHSFGSTASRSLLSAWYSAEFESAEPAYDIDVYLPAGAVTLIKPDNVEGQRMLTEPRACCADVVARLRPGTTERKSAAELGLLARGWTAVSGQPARGAIVNDTTFMSQPGRSDSAQALLTVTMLAGGLVLVWLIACANVGNLMLARTLARLRRDRHARGARRQPRPPHTTAAHRRGGARNHRCHRGYRNRCTTPALLFRFVADASTRVQFPFPVAPDTSVLTGVVAIGLASALVFSLAPALIVTRIATKRVTVRDLGAGRTVSACAACSSAHRWR